MEQKPTVLLIEDNKDDISLFKVALKQAYPEVALQAVTNVTDAMDYLHGSGGFKARETFPLPYALVVDLTLPIISGSYFVKWVRIQPAFGKVLITAWTGSRDGQDIAQLYRLGANSFLTKTDSVAKLVKDLRDLHEFWHQVGLLVDFVPQVDYSIKPSKTPRQDFFYRIEDWPGFQPPTG